MKRRSTLAFISLLLALTGCSLAPPYEPETQALEPGRLPPPNAALTIPGLGPCTDSPDPTLHLDTNQPVTVLVHGCNGSAGRFRSLAQLYAFHGQQAVCFSYDDRDTLLRSSGKLITAVETLAGKIRTQDVTVIGHSMGGLVARKAMEKDRREWQRGPHAARDHLGSARRHRRRRPLRFTEPALAEPGHRPRHLLDDHRRQLVRDHLGFGFHSAP
jgi:hypothetical protein